MKDGVERNIGKGLFYFFFEYPPHLIGLTVTDLEAREFAFDWWHKHLNRPIQDLQDIPGGDGGYRSGQDIPASRSFLGLDNTAPPKDLEDFLEVVLREMLCFGNSVDREGFGGLSEGEYCPEAIISLF